jgi:hypothetical protein
LKEINIEEIEKSLEMLNQQEINQTNRIQHLEELQKADMEFMKKEFNNFQILMDELKNSTNTNQELASEVKVLNKTIQEQSELIKKLGEQIKTLEISVKQENKQFQEHFNQKIQNLEMEFQKEISKTNSDLTNVQKENDENFESLKEHFTEEIASLQNKFE